LLELIRAKTFHEIKIHGTEQDENPQKLEPCKLEEPHSSPDKLECKQGKVRR